MTEESRIALLIDADNCPAAKIEVILDELAKYGVTNVRRAYGNWKSSGLKGWEEVLHEYAIQPIQQFAYTKGKNATDSAMIIDAMDLLYTQKLDAFCIASSDSDFTPLVMRIRANGLKVYGFGEKKTPMPFVNACSRFLYLETLGVAAPAEEDPAAAVQKKSAKELKGDARLVTLLRNAVDACLDEDGWAALSAVGSHISNQTSFDQRNYGYKKLSDLIEATGLFEAQRRNTHLYLRDKRTVKKAPA
ncbi:NYN domain-containing protein [Pseudothauera nasutitermitis]|uniref:NYN domain-containing protein n=1 Tax=Pseudothauera nasutitermitis TaxID=2565930 RepID=A0A4S4B1S6_9RHOO|nr:NYN domain-containing protein [Pseudothauera nasutitermitis]THF66409.1 NYN domain-containing protein [Pseudothauera nasutitermitis]